MPSASSKKDLSQWLAPSYFCFSCREPQEYALSNQHPSIAYGRVLHPMCDQSLSAHWGLILMGRAHSRQCYGIFWGFVWTIIQYNFSFSLILIHHHLYLQVLISNYLAQKASHYLCFFSITQSVTNTINKLVLIDIFCMLQSTPIEHTSLKSAHGTCHWTYSRPYYKFQYISKD